jgi:hypothetical protein
VSLKINIQKDSGTNAVTKSVVVGSGKAITPTGSGIIEATNLLGSIDASQVSTGTLAPARLPLGLGTDTAPANGTLLIGNGAGYTTANLTAGTNISITNSAGGITIANTMPSGLIYQGAWDALTNTPTLTSSVGTQGNYYVVSVAGTTNLNGITDWQIGDWAIFNGTIWQKIDNSDQVTSVFGRQGAVVATSGDYTASQITNIPYSGILSTNVQSAINELYDDIQATQQVLTAYVTNAESFSISRGQVVYLFGAQGNRASVKLASNLSDATSAKTFGLVADASIAANGAGYIRCQGVVGNLNLGAYQPGDTLYLGSTPGSLTATKPYAPYHLVYVGIVERANNGNGQLYVKIQNGYELDEIHDVQITAPKLAGQTLLYDATNALWKNARLTAGTGMTLTFADASVTLTPNFAAPPVIGNTTPNVVNATTLNATDVAATNGTFLSAVTTPYVKADTGVYLTLQGGSTGASLVLGLGANGQATFDRKLNLTASTTSAASLNLPQGTAPTTPTNGDLWTTSSGLYVRIAGSTVGPLGSGSGAGTVTSVSVTTANGVSGTVANPTTTPAITLTLGAITPSSVAATGTVTGSNLSGTNTGDQTITLTGNVTGSGTGSFATTIAAGVVTNSMLANVATSTFKGRTTAGSGSPEDLTGTQATALLDTFTSTLKGLAPSSGGGTTNFLRADGTWATPPGGGGTVTSVSVVTANGVSGSVANATTTPAITLTLGAITPSSVAATGTVTGSNLSGTNTGDQTITLTGNVTGSGTGSFATTIAAGVVTNSMLANVSTATFKGRTTAGTGSPEDLTGTQATALLDTFTSTLKGLAPSSGGGTSNYLRADGTWATPPGTGGGGGTTGFDQTFMLMGA